MTTDKECCGRCSQPDCTVENDGTCLEGFDDLNDCPHFVPEDVPSGPPPQEQIEERAQVGKIEYVVLHDGEGLRIDDAGIVMRRSPTKVIIVAGTADSGKTTLLASLYECFNEGGVGGALFAGSKTLLGFERRCHLARISCGAENPDTERTKPGDEGVLLHLCTRTSELNMPAVDMLLTDISGEIFKEIRSSSDECKRHEIIRRADHFVLLFDGARIIDMQSRHQNYISGRTLLRSCMDSGMLESKTVVDIVFTKWDRIHALEGDAAENVKQFIGMVCDEIKKLFSEKGNSLNFYEVAARPKNSELEFGHGLSELFACWSKHNVEEGHLLDENEIYASQGRYFKRYSLARFS
jgi:hypothetical protein